MIDTDALQKFDSFILALSKKDRIALIFHTDADGICAGVIAAKAVGRITGKKPALFLHPAASSVVISEKMILALKRKKINKVVVVDLNVDQEPRSIKELEKFGKILVLDHHSIQNDINSEKTLMIKPQMFSNIEPSKYCGAKLVYDLFSRKADLSSLKWLAVIGIYGDMAEREWGHFIENAIKENSVSLADLMEAGKLIVYARSADEEKGPMEAFKVFLGAESPKDVLESNLRQYEERIEKEITHYIENREKLAEFYPEKKLLIYEISAKYNIKSELVNRLSREYYPEWTCIVIQKKGKTASIGARNQSGGVAMNELMITATEGIKDASGGGHVQAAGANVPSKDVERFKKRVLDTVGKGTR